jgi:hypothetical protein
MASRSTKLKWQTKIVVMRMDRKVLSASEEVNIKNNSAILEYNKDKAGSNNKQMT